MLLWFFDDLQGWGRGVDGRVVQVRGGGRREGDRGGARRRVSDHRQGEAGGDGGRAVAETQLQVGDHLRLARLERLDRGVVCCVAPVPAGKSHFLDRFWKTEIQSLVLIVFKGRREGSSSS